MSPAMTMAQRRTATIRTIEQLNRGPAFWLLFGLLTALFMTAVTGRLGFGFWSFQLLTKDPFTVELLVAISVFGAPFVLAAIENGYVSLSRWKVFTQGDAICLPVGYGAMSKCIHKFHGSDRWYMSHTFWLAMILLPLGMQVFLSIGDLKLLGTMRRYYLIPHSWAHNLNVFYFGWLAAIGMIPALVAGINPLWKLVMIIAFACWGYLAVQGNAEEIRLGILPDPTINY